MIVVYMFLGKRSAVKDDVSKKTTNTIIQYNISASVMICFHFVIVDKVSALIFHL